MVRMLIIGTCHEYQRWQEDGCPERNRVRCQLDPAISKIVASRRVELIAEEAGDDALVAKRLTEQGYRQGPKETIAKQVSENYPFCRHVDVCPRGRRRPPARLYTQEMFNAILTALGGATSVLVICGEDHRRSLFSRFSRRGFQVQSRRFPARR